MHNNLIQFRLLYLFNEQEKAKDGQSTEGALAPASYIKHPLQNKWALWFFKNDKTKSWKANLRLVTSFDTVSFADQYLFIDVLLCSLECYCLFCIRSLWSVLASWFKADMYLQPPCSCCFYQT